MTTAARICRLYMSELNPTDELTRLTSYIINVYMPTWLRIHWHHNIKYASQHLLDEIQSIQQHCSEEDREIALKSVNINGFHGHLEIVLTCILASADQYTRQDAVSNILAIRMRIEEEKIVDSKKQDASKKKGASKKRKKVRRTKFQGCKN